ncbi:PQQ-dependent dehydrogenase, methanol/ethanol family, partial [Methylococcaceae bacterium CS4]
KSLLLASSVAALLTAPAISSANSGVEKLTKNPANWATALGNYAGTRYSKLDQINAKNVKNLQPAWSFSTGVLRGHEGGPLVIGDVIYIHTPFPNTVYALDQATRSVIWEYTPQMDADVTIPVMCCDTVNRGLAYGDGKIFLQQSDTVLTALDAKTGKRIWSVQNGDPKLGMTNTQAPLVVNDKIITGIAGGEFGVRGFLAAYDMKSGQLAWKGYSMGPDGDTIINPNKTTTWENGKVTKVGKNSGTNTWEGDQWKIGGGTTWGWYSYDPDLNLVYYGSGNPSTWNPVQRPGDNKWSMSLWARDADTGEVKWVYQMTPHDEWDFDGINEVVLADQKIGGKMRKTIVHFDRNGFGYTLDRVTGELLVAEKFDKTVNWATHIDMKSGRPVLDLKYSTEANGEDENTEGACPAALGSKNQQPVSYSPQTKLFYISANH